MATATKQVRAAKAAAVTRVEPGPTAPAFLVYQDNGGGHHWEIVDRGGQSLVQSERFASEDDARHAARLMQQGARSAHFEPRGLGSSHRVPVMPTRHLGCATYRIIACQVAATWPAAR